MERRSTGWHGPLERFTPGRTLKVGRNGEIDLPIDPESPFYFTDRGLQMRTGGGLSLTTGSPVALVRDEITAAEVQDVGATVADGLRRLTAALAALITIKARGTATLVAGTVTVSTTSVVTGDLIYVSNVGTGGTIGVLSSGNVVDATSFDVTSSSILDTSTVAWMVVSP